MSDYPHIAVPFVVHCGLLNQRYNDSRPTTYDSRPTTYDSRPTTYNLRPTTYDSRPTTYDSRPTTHQRTTHNFLKAVIGALIVFAIVAYIVFYTPLLSYVINSLKLGEPEYVELEVTRKFDILTDRRIDYSVHLPVPKNIDGIQTITYKTTPQYTPTTMYGILWMNWSGTLAQSPSAPKTQTIIIDYKITTRARKFEYSRDDVLTVNDIPQSLKTKFPANRDEWKITPTDSTLRTVAQTVTGGKTNVYDILESIYNYMTKEYKYETIRDSEVKSAIQTYNDKRGDCDDQSVLFATLARAVNVPAWLELGAIYDPIMQKWIGHGWVKSYMPIKDGSGIYVYIDVVNYQVYPFLFRSANRYTEWESDGNPDHMRYYYYYFSYTYSAPQPNVDFKDSIEGKSFSGSNYILTINPLWLWLIPIVCGAITYVAIRRGE